MRLFFVIFVSTIFFLSACSNEEISKEKEPRKVSSSAQTDASQTALPKTPMKQDKMSKEEIASSGKRKYKFPSMMVKEV